MAESEEELKSFLIKVKEKSEKVGSTFRKLRLCHHFMANGWGKNGNSDRLVFLGFIITVDGDYGHEIKRHLLLGRKVMTNLDSILRSRDITLPTKVLTVKAMVFPVVMYGCESWTIKRLSAKESMPLNCAAGEDSQESLGQQGGQTSQF